MLRRISSTEIGIELTVKIELYYFSHISEQSWLVSYRYESTNGLEFILLGSGVFIIVKSTTFFSCCDLLLIVKVPKTSKMVKPGSRDKLDYRSD